MLRSPSLRIIIVFLLSIPALFAQESVTPLYKAPETGVLKYKQVEKTDAYTQVENGLDADINRKTESYFTLSGLPATDANLNFAFMQDTVFVEDNSRTKIDNAASNAFLNIITKKRIQFRITPQGALVTASALDRLNRPPSVPASVPDSYFAQQANFLPPLPTRAIKPGDTWTETHADTLNYSRTTRDIDSSDNVVYVTSTTTWTIGDWETVSGRRCLKIASRNIALTETKRIVGREENFVEDHRTTTATVLLDPAQGVLVKCDIKSASASTLATYGVEPSVRPSTITVEKSITLLPS